MNTNYVNKNGVEHWHEQALGQALHQIEQTLLDKILPQLFGFHLVYKDVFREPYNLQASPINHRICLSDHTERSATMSIVRGECEELPFATKSLDVVLLVHALEYSPHPEILIKEACRAIVPEGHIVILGFNPYSLWGLRSLLPYPRNTQPWSARFKSASAVKKMLATESCTPIYVSHYFYRPPLQQTEYLNKAIFLERIGAVCWPRLGGAYALVAKKQIAGLTPIKPQWLRLKKLRVKGILETTL